MTASISSTGSSVNFVAMTNPFSDQSNPYQSPAELPPVRAERARPEAPRRKSRYLYPIITLLIGCAIIGLGRAIIRDMPLPGDITQICGGLLAAAAVFLIFYRLTPG